MDRATAGDRRARPRHPRPVARGDDSGAIPQSEYTAYVPSVSTDGVNTSVTVRNTGTDHATIAMRFRRDDGSNALASDPTFGLAAGASELVYLPNLASLPAGQMALTVVSTQPVSAVVGFGAAASGASSGMNAVGFDDTGYTLHFGRVLRAYAASTSLLSVHNLEGAAATVDLQYFGRAGGEPVLRETRTIPAYGTLRVDQAAQAALGEGFQGSAVVRGDRLLAGSAAVASIDGRAVSTNNAPSAGATRAYVAGLYKEYYSYNSSLVVQNADETAAEVEVTYSNGVVRAVTIQPGAAALLYQPNDPDLPAGWQGSATVHSTNAKRILASATVASAALGQITSSEAVRAGADDLSVTGLYNDYSSLRWNSALLIQNVDTAATVVEVVYSGGLVQQYGLAAGASQLVYLPNVAGLPAGWQGSASVRSLSGRMLNAAVNSSSAAPSLAGQDSLVTFVAAAQ